MRYFTLALVVFLILSMHSMSRAQGTGMKDTVYLMNGEIIAATITDTAFYGLKIVKTNSDPAKKHEIIIEGERIFSYKLANGFEKTVYYQDTMIGNEFTVEETRLFLLGERDADKGFRSRLWPASSMVLGAASAGVMNNLLVFGVPFFYAAGSILPKVNIRHNTVSNLGYLKSDTYILGYERVARKKRTLQTFVGGVIGLGVGFAARSVYNSVNK